MELKERVRLAEQTTFAIGGPVRFWADVANEEDIYEVHTLARERGLSVVVLGGGSNVLAPDSELSALVIHPFMNAIAREGSVVRAQAGASLMELVRYATGHGLSGLEHLAGIPGSVGGAVRGNAGAFGSEICDSMVSVRTLDLQEKKERVFDTAACQFSYRSSFFKKHPELVILETTLQLHEEDPTTLTAAVEHTLAERTRRHIQDIKSAGSFFTNPVVSLPLQQLFEQEKGVASKRGRVPAGWLMEKVGLRGARVGDAVASAYHTNYFLNDEHASAADVKALAQLAKEKVFAQFGVRLEEEVTIL